MTSLDQAQDVIADMGFTRQDLIAYLEKQKDRLAPIYEDIDSFESALGKAWKDYNDSGARIVDGCEDDYVECAHAKGFREGYLFGIEKQKEQKPTEDWREKRKKECPFRRKLDSNLYGCEQYADVFCECNGNCSWVVDYPKLKEIQDRKERKPAEINEYEIIKKHITGDSLSSEVNKRLKECGWYVTEQNPAEWSEEDEKMAKFYEADYNHKVGNLPAKQVVEMRLAFRDWIVNRIKYLRPQPKQEWNEEDRRIADRIQMILEFYDRNYPGGGDIESEVPKYIDWLKSLRPQPKQVWSKEDEEALERAINCVRTWEIDYCDGDNEISERLKSFNGRFYLQPKNEWKHYIWAVNLRFDYDALVRYEDNGAYEIVTAGNKPKRQVSGDYFLLKDTAYKEFHKNWKPSEKQMKALDSAINYFTEHTCTPGNSLLISLYHDIKNYFNL